MARGRVRVSSAGLARCTMTVPPRLRAVYTCPVACLAPLSGLRTQVAQHRQRATVVVGCGGQLEPAKKKIAHDDTSPPDSFWRAALCAPGESRYACSRPANSGELRGDPNSHGRVPRSWSRCI